jgi:hypothetical protein
MKLSNQAMGAIMMALQKSLMDQSDITPVLTGFDFINTDSGLVVENPPVIQYSGDIEDEELSNNNA